MLSLGGVRCKLLGLAHASCKPIQGANTGKGFSRRGCSCGCWMKSVIKTHICTHTHTHKHTHTHTNTHTHTHIHIHTHTHTHTHMLINKLSHTLQQMRSRDVASHDTHTITVRYNTHCNAHCNTHCNTHYNSHCSTAHTATLIATHTQRMR